MIVFGFFIVFGMIAFSSYKATKQVNTTTEIKVWGTIDKTVFDSFIKKYQEDNSIKFNLTYTYKSIDTIDNLLVEAIATGNGPDAILVPQSLEKRYLDKVLLIPFSNISERTFRDTFVQESDIYVYPNGIFALPLFVDPMLMYWNKDMFATAGIALPPTKWSEFPQLASKLSQSDSNANIISSAASLGEYRNVDNAKALLSTLILQAGSPIVSFTNNSFNAELKFQSSNDVLVPTVSALQFFTDYSNPKKSIYSWNRSLPSSKQSFISENLATFFGFASEYQDIKDKNPNLNFDVAIMPQALGQKTSTTFGNIYGFSILKSSKNPTLTFSLLSSITDSSAASVFLGMTNYAPARKDLISIGSTDPIKTIFYNSALISKAWIDPDSKKTDKIFQDMVENITTGQLDVSGSVSKANGELDVLLL